MSDAEPKSPSFRNLDQFLPIVSVEVGALTGQWINIAETAQGWTSLQVTEGQESWSLECHLAGGSTVSFNAVNCFGGINGPALTAISSVAHDQHGSEIRLQGNFNLGLLVLASFKTPADGTVGYFSREFFAFSNPLDLKDATPIQNASQNTGLFGYSGAVTPPDVSTLLCRWRNTDIAAPGLERILISEEGANITAQAFGAPLSSDAPAVDWGTTQVDIFACLDETGKSSIAALASWQLGPLTATLQIRPVGGAIAIAGFNRFSDGRMGYSTREFFYQYS